MVCDMLILVLVILPAGNFYNLEVSCPLLERYLADLALALSPCVTPMCVELILANSGRFFGFQAFY